MFNISITPEQRLSKAVVALMSKPEYLWMSGLLMIGERKIKDDVPTACTNGRDEYYGRAFVESLSDAELRAVVVHECKHKLYRHLHIWNDLFKINAQCANMACDYVINLEIVDENRDGFCKLPDNGLLDDTYRGMDTKQVFDILMQDPPQGGGGGGGFDDHDWDGAEELDAEEKQALEEEIDTAIRQGILAADKSGVARPMHASGMLATKVDWRQVLREFVTTHCAGNDESTWAKPNRRYIGSDIYMPSTYSETVKELCIDIDTSGSIWGGNTMAKFMGALYEVCQQVRPERIRVLYWDTSVTSQEVFTTDEAERILTLTRPTGGGGTDPHCLPKFKLENNIRPDATIVLTDGYFFHGTGSGWDNTLWCIVDNKSFTTTTGKVVHIED